ncbi:MAG: TRAP transporter small permease [Clostridiales bacterium]|nr:TRAP transporter small permease [Clostridiales bacterium]MCD8008406.1 TRAP transporter small permease [Clostridiales bacterium]
MKTLDKILDLVMRFVMAVAMGALVVFGTWQIFTRFILNNPSTFTDEVLRYVLIWASLLGSAYCFYKDEHLSLDLVKDRVHGAASAVLFVFIEIMTLFFVCYVFVYGGGRLMMNATNVSSVLHIPYKVLYSIIPISGVFIVVARILKYIQIFTGSNKEVEE